MEHTLEVKSITHNFGNKNIFSWAEITCKTGEVLGIFGRNGTGKSTLFKILFGALKANEIELYLDGHLYDRSFTSNFIGYHPQEIMLPKDLLVRDIISLYIKGEENQNKVHYAEGIAAIQNQKVGRLSLGQQRYLQFLLVLNLTHSFILLDEPFSMVEPLYKELIKEKIIAYKSCKGFLITDHYYLDVLDIADRACLIKDGKIISIAKTEDLVSNEYLSEKSIII